jgi:formate hydrogenlyase subunit 3/multisubunit Na+/H+ antiporter MnhD subunit
MRLNKNSVSSRLYKWFYAVSEYQGLPNNLCPYFWKLVLMYLTIIPYTLISIPVVVYDMFDKQYENGERKTGERLGISVGIYIGLFILTTLISAILALFIKVEKNTLFEFLVVGGCLFWTGLIVIGVIEGVKHLREYSTRDESYFDEQQDKWVVKKAKVNMTTEFIKAKYNKYCPKIDWYQE